MSEGKNERIVWRIAIIWITPLVLGGSWIACWSVINKGHTLPKTSHCLSVGPDEMRTCREHCNSLYPKRNLYYYFKVYSNKTECICTESDIPDYSRWAARLTDYCDFLGLEATTYEANPPMTGTSVTCSRPQPPAHIRDRIVH